MEKQMNNDSKDLPTDPPGDDLGIRCPRLGHQINFSYCSSENSGLPCFKTLDCWYQHFDVHIYLKNKLSEQDFDKIFLTKGKPKVFSLLDLIEQAKKKKENKE
ncbi:MAG: hypothetical protein GY707_01985 [Desulfobacteraceae bacterium]|nr:hypothetical protein [Desulfobacteraceae bacterium]